MTHDNVDMSHPLEARIRISLTASPTVVFVDDRIHELLGFKAEDFLTSRVSLKDRIHAHDQDIADDLFSTGTGQASGTFNIRIRQANGRIRCIKGHYTRELDNSGTDTLLELLLQDAKSLSQNCSEQPITASFRAMMENTDDYIYSKDRNHVFTGASQTLVAVTSPAEHWTDLLGLTDYDVFPEEYADIYYRLEKQVFAGIRVAHEIQETLDNDGNKGWVDNRKYPIYDDEGEIIGLFGIARVITERKLLEERLLQFKHTLDQTLDCVFMFRQDDFHFIYVNEGAKQQVGYTEAELLNMTPLDIKPEFTLERFLQMVRPLIDGAQSVHKFQTVHRHKNGQDIPVEIALQFVRKDGLESLFVAIVRDITERRQVEEVLRSSETKLRTLYDSTNDAIMLLGEKNFFDCNKATLALFGCATLEDFCSKHPADLSPPKQPCGADSLTLAQEHISFALKNGKRHFEWVHRRVDTGEIFPVDVLLSAMMLDGKQILQAVVRDITERRQAERRVFVEQELRARDLAMRELLAYVERKREEDRKYIAREIHDELGQTLSALRLETSMLQNKKNMDVESIDTIRRNMLKLVDRAIQGMRTVAVNLRPASLELGVISAIRKLSDEFFKHTGMSCILQITENMIDPDEECAVAIFRIVQESLTNVMKHAAASRVEITLKQSIDTLIIKVRDNGKGFNSADSGKRKSFGLIGMRERVAAMGGRIDIVSIQRQGTVVTAHIPIKQNEEISDFTI